MVLKIIMFETFHLWFYNVMKHVFQMYVKLSGKRIKQLWVYGVSFQRLFFSSNWYLRRKKLVGQTCVYHRVTRVSLWRRYNDVYCDDWFNKRHISICLLAGLAVTVKDMVFNNHVLNQNFWYEDWLCYSIFLKKYERWRGFLCELLYSGIFEGLWYFFACILRTVAA